MAHTRMCVCMFSLPTLPVFPGVSKFFIKSPGKNLPWPLSICFVINFIIFEMSKRKIKQEVDFVFLFELLSIVKRKQSNQIYIYWRTVSKLVRDQPMQFQNTW